MDPLRQEMFQVAVGYWLSKALYCAAQAGVADRLAAPVRVGLPPMSGATHPERSEALRLEQPYRLAIRDDVRGRVPALREIPQPLPLAPPFLIPIC